MASIRRPHSPAKHQQLLAARTNNPFSVSTTPPSSPLRHSSSAASSPRRHPPSSSSSFPPYPYVWLWWWRWWRRPLLRFFSFFLLGSFIGLLLHLSHLPLPNKYDPETLLHREPATEYDGQPDPSKLLIIVTPTRATASQAYHLHRLAQTLRLVPPPLLWLVVDDRQPDRKSSIETTADLLRGSSIMYRHIITDRIANSSDAEATARQRNAALELIEIHRLDGIVYFADDYNVYSHNLFHRLREIKRFGTWPVAVLSQSESNAILEGPVCKGSEVVGWHVNDKSKTLRRFHVHMSGFAFNSTMLWDSELRARLSWNAIRHLDKAKDGFQETAFIEQLVADENQMEGVPPGCSQVMNWHLDFISSNLVYPQGWRVSRNLDVVIPL